MTQDYTIRVNQFTSDTVIMDYASFTQMLLLLKGQVHLGDLGEPIYSGTLDELVDNLRRADEQRVP